MKKKTIITLSILLFFIVLTSILFGAVFCLRTQSVTVVGDSAISVGKEEIISAGGFKTGRSIFLLDKEKAISNIEAKYADVKVVQIKTTSVTKIEICVRARHKMFYTVFNDKYYIMDEELKVLEIKEIETDQGVNPVPELTHIKDGSLNINNSTLKCDFIGSEFQQKAIYALNQAMLNNVKTKTDTVTQYYTRVDLVDMFEFVEFESYESFDKIILTTKYGVKFDIENPSENLSKKLSICLATLNSLIEEDQGDRQASGVIKIYYDINGVQHNVYIPKDNNQENGN